MKSAVIRRRRVGGGSLAGILFSASEPGFTFEPWDITTLYQDRVGTTPVTAAGQSVGLRLDKSKGLALGPELVTNGDFATDTSWTKGAGWTIGGGTANAASASGVLQQVVSVTSGKYYRVTFTATFSAGNFQLRLGGADGGYHFVSGTKSVLVLAGASGLLEFVATTLTCTLDNISVRELAGNHQIAINDAQRGVYGRMPKTGRRNLLTYTEQFDNAAWTKDRVSVSVNATIAPDGTTTADKVTDTLGGANTYRTYNSLTLSAIGYTQTFYAKAAEYSWCYVRIGTASRAWFNISDGTVGTVNAGLTASITSVGGGWYRISCTISTATAGAGFGLIGLTNANGAEVYTPTTGGMGIYVWGAQLEAGSTATAYQRVASQYDVTEAGVPTCYYVQADGVDDAYVTPTITPNTDKVQVFAGVRKLSDAATGMLIETSGSFFSTNGTLAIVNPWEFYINGTAPAGWSATQVAPVNNVITMLGDISGATRVEEVMPRINGIAATVGGGIAGPAGTGNFLAYPAYIYGRGGTSLPFNGLDFGHAVRFGPNLDAATIARVEALIARNTPEVTL